MKGKRLIRRESDMLTMERKRDSLRMREEFWKAKKLKCKTL